jgi:hypothetical protein
MRMAGPVVAESVRSSFYVLVKDSETGKDGGLVIREWIVGQSDPRIEIPPIRILRERGV